MKKKLPCFAVALTGLVVIMATGCGRDNPASSTKPPQVPAVSPSRVVLEELYNTTGGENWTNNANWTSGKPIGSWYGVTATNDAGNDGLSARATAGSGLQRLDLSGNNLSGEIPAALGNLVDLRYLDLSENALSGGIPAALGGLTKLEVMKLHGNTGLAGPLPHTFANFAALDTLSLSGTQLCAPADTTFQTWLNGVESKSGVVTCGDPSNADRSVLIALYIGTDGANWMQQANWVTNEPLSAWYGVSTNAEGRVDSLNLENNGLSGQLPAAVAQLTDLMLLDLSDNALTGTIPLKLFSLPNLVTLDLTGNQFSDIPEPPEPTTVLSRIQVSPSMASIEEGGTQQFEAIAMTETGTTISDVVFTWTSSDDGIATIDTEGFATGVSSGEVVITATADGISGTAALTVVVPQLSDRDVLVALYNGTGGANWNRNNNWLTDRPIEEWQGVTVNAEGRVTALRLGHNRLRRRIPTELGNLSQLVILDLEDNDMTGPIPVELGNLINLKFLDTDENDLSGPIPAELGNLTNLEIMDIDENDFTGPIPAELGDLTNLQTLEIGGNRGLTGPLPDTFTNLINLERLWTYRTGLCAPSDAEFQAWLRGVRSRRGVVNCPVSERSRQYDF